MDTKPCAQCGATIVRGDGSYMPSAPQWARRRFCTPECARLAQMGAPSWNAGHRKPLRETLLEHLDIRGPDECWEWQGARAAQPPNHYGIIQRPEGRHFAHRVAYTEFVGPIPEGKHVLHRCDNPPCANPKHLYTGTPKDNARDRTERGRDGGPRRRGQMNGRARLTAAQVQAIRHRYLEGVTQTVIASEFGVSQGYVSRIVRGVQRDEE